MLFGVFKVIPGKSRTFVKSFETNEAACRHAETLADNETDGEVDRYEIEQLPEPRRAEPATNEPGRKAPPGQLKMF